MLHYLPTKGMHSDCYRNNLNQCLSPVALQLQTKASPDARGGWWLCSALFRAIAQENIGRRHKLPNSVTPRRSVWARGDRRWDARTSSSPTRTVSARVQDSKGCPWMSGWAQKLLQPQDVTLTPLSGLWQLEEQNWKLSLFWALESFFLQDESVAGAAANTVVSALPGTPVKIFRLVRITNMQERFSLFSVSGWDPVNSYKE